MSQMRALAGVVGLLLLGAVVYVATPATPYPEAITIGQGVKDFSDLSSRFVSLAQKKGAVYAFDVLKIVALPPNTDLHLLGHVVGDELYKQKGVDGIAYCTQDFRNACSHTVVIGALKEFGAGDKTLAMIDVACHKAPGGLGAYTMCYHGLGHGVFAYFGYDLQKTVSFCKRMGTAEYHDEQYAQCVGGAVMELMGGGGHDHELWLVARTKYIQPSDPLSPCMNSLIPDRAKSFCFEYLTPQLFVLAGAQLGAPDPQFFPKAFSYCDAIPKERKELRRACFGGFGKEFVPIAGARDIRAVDKFSDEEYSTAASWCALSPIQEGAEDCVREALQSVFWGGENDPHASVRFCADAASALHAACYDELAHAIEKYLPDSQDICQLLPKESRSVCATIAPYKTSAAVSPKQEEQRWQDRVAVVGGKAAYGEFATATLALTAQEQHELAHSFGGALFEAEGTSSLAVCDARFSYGCFHEFLGRAITRLGLSSVEGLNEACLAALTTSPLSCQHGIGHGILAYLGYTEKSLRQALEICKSLPHSDPIGGCYQGVFMEYNLQTMLGEAGRVRPLENNDYYYPCDMLDPAYAPACIFEQVQWWHLLLNRSDDASVALYARLGRLCSEAATPFQRSCFEGLGTVTLSLPSLDPAQAKRLCEAASSNKTQELYCKAFAANGIFVADGLKPARAEKVCAGLQAGQSAFCLSYANNRANLAQPLKSP